MTDLTALRELNKRRTQGDWRVEGDDEPWPGTEAIELAAGSIGTRTFRQLAYVLGDGDELDDEAHANARLLSLATELYPLAEALDRALEELRLIRMKDCGAVYDVAIRTTGAALLDALMTKVRG